MTSVTYCTEPKSSNNPAHSYRDGTAGRCVPPSAPARGNRLGGPRVDRPAVVAGFEVSAPVPPAPDRSAVDRRESTVDRARLRARPTALRLSGALIPRGSRDAARPPDPLRFRTAGAQLKGGKLAILAKYVRDRTIPVADRPALPRCRAPEGVDCRPSRRVLPAGVALLQGCASVGSLYNTRAPPQP